MRNRLVLSRQYEITEVVKKTQSAAFKGLEVGDGFVLSMSVWHGAPVQVETKNGHFALYPGVVRSVLDNAFVVTEVQG